MATTNQNGETAKSSPAVKKRRSTRKGVVARKRRSTAKTRQGSRAKSSARAMGTSEFLNQGRSALSSAYDQVASAGRSLPKISRYVTDGRKRQSITRMIEERPYVLGAVGLGIGMVLAALMPSTRGLHGDAANTRSRRK